MNIFRLDEDPVTAAAAHNDSHVRKMPTEYAQLLSTAIRVHGGRKGRIVHPKRGLCDYAQVLEGEDGATPVIYLTSHLNHGCSVWARETRANWDWLYQLYHSTAAEYAFRFGRRHGALEVADALAARRELIPVGPMTMPPQTLAEECKVPGNAVQAYRNYYVIHKRGYLWRSKWVTSTWTKRPQPTWYK